MFPATSVADHSVMIPVSGKLRGRSARQLGGRLEDLADDGVTRVILDFRSLTCMDSLGTFALEAGLDRGLQLHLVVKPNFSFDGFFTSRSLNRRADIAAFELGLRCPGCDHTLRISRVIECPKFN